MDRVILSEHASGVFPSIRVWLCGAFQVAWVDPATGDLHPLSETELCRADAPQALSLFKLLLCQPGRAAHRDVILEHLWPEHAHSVACHRLHNIASVLRALLQPPDGLPLLPAISGKKESLYTLPAYPRLWVDRDAILWNVEQAQRMERFGDESLPYWQRAYDLLSRGPFLAAEPYADWRKDPHEEMMGANRQCVQHLWRLCVARHGEAGKAEALHVLRSYWQQHQTDEDILRVRFVCPKTVKTGAEQQREVCLVDN